MRNPARLLIAAVLLTGCIANPTPIPTVQPSPTETVSPTPFLPTQTSAPTASVQPSATPKAGAAAIDSSIDPLTGLAVSDPNLLDRRPMAIKIENLPRGNRPQYGLTAADIVYEYYTEQGTTRFTAVFYGQDAERVGPIRSGRFFDANVIQMYQAVFAFGSAYEAVLERFNASDFAERMVIEGGNNCPPMCRLDPNGRNILYTDTQELTKYFTEKGIDNTRQDLSGMTFDTEVPQGGQAASQVYVRFSSAIYNRWDYDPATGKYLRWVDKQDAGDPASEVYVQLTDKENKQQISAENVVIIYVPYIYIAKTDVTEVFDMQLIGSGLAYAIRDGQIYPVQWQRSAPDKVMTLVNADGSPFMMKPGQTWFEIVNTASEMKQADDEWRFQFVRP